MDKQSSQKKEVKVEVGEPIWVQCEGYRCLAYLNQRGEWRAYFDNSKLPDTIKVLGNPADN
jgi:hypothetical protein